MCNFLYFFVVILLLGGCATKQELGAITTGSALAVAVPLTPLTEAYHAINDTEGKATQQREKWQKQFDPIYEKKIETILSRDPIADAILKYNENKIVFIPGMSSIELYVGLRWDTEKTYGELNQEIIDNDKFLTFILKLLSNDPVHEKEAGYKYNSQTYDCFAIKVFDYKAAFNTKMSELSGKYSPNKNLKRDC